MTCSVFFDATTEPRIKVVCPRDWFRHQAVVPGHPRTEIRGGAKTYEHLLCQSVGRSVLMVCRRPRAGAHAPERPRFWFGESLFMEGKTSGRGYGFIFRSDSAVKTAPAVARCSLPPRSATVAAHRSSALHPQPAGTAWGAFAVTAPLHDRYGPVTRSRSDYRNSNGRGEKGCLLTSRKKDYCASGLGLPAL
jgi:hypothetical protein